jgi:hypothetical protein
MRFTIEAACLEKMSLVEKEKTLGIASMVVGALVPLQLISGQAVLR